MDKIKELYPNNRYRVLVIYDVSESKNRYRISKILESYGIRIQRSAFECLLTKTQIKTMTEKLKKYIDIASDRLDIYRFSEQTHSESFGYKPELANALFSVI